MPHAPCSMLHAPCPIRYALCSMLYALCPLLYALCSMRSAPCALLNKVPAIRRFQITLYCRPGCGEGHEYTKRDDKYHAKNNHIEIVGKEGMAGDITDP